jgi:hypothetical protein
VPIVIGGHTVKAAQRAAKLGDGFFPGAAGTDELSSLFDVVRSECAAAGRDPSEVEFTASGGGRTLDEVSERVEQLTALGVTRVILSPLRKDRLIELADGLRDRFGMT